MPGYLRTLTHERVTNPHGGVCIVRSAHKLRGQRLPDVRVLRSPIMIIGNFGNRLYAVSEPELRHEWQSNNELVWLPYRKYKNSVDIVSRDPQTWKKLCSSPWVKFDEGVVRFCHLGHYDFTGRRMRFANETVPHIALITLEVIPSTSPPLKKGMDGRWECNLYLYPNKLYFIYDFGNWWAITCR